MSRLRVVVAVSAFLALVAAPAASAHEGNPNYRSVINGVTPKVSGIHLQVLNLDDRLEMRNTSGRTVIVQGYEGEPYARLLADGTVQVNRRSPAFYLNEERFGGVKVPASADPKAAPRWDVIDRTGRFEWHDHRIHWMSDVPPNQVTDTSRRTKVFDWSVPLRVGGTPVAVRGSLFWQPTAGGGVPAAAIAALAALVVAGAGAVVLVRRRRRSEGPDEAGDEVEAW